MSLQRLIHTAMASLMLGSTLSACMDGNAPSPPPRVPKPKVEHEPVDPIKTGPTQEKTIREV